MWHRGRQASLSGNQLQFQTHSLTSSILLCAWKVDFYEPYQPAFALWLPTEVSGWEGLAGDEKVDRVKLGWWWLFLCPQPQLLSERTRLQLQSPWVSGISSSPEEGGGGFPL